MQGVLSGGPEGVRGCVHVEPGFTFQGALVDLDQGRDDAIDQVRRELALLYMRREAREQQQTYEEAARKFVPVWRRWR